METTKKDFAKLDIKIKPLGLKAMSKIIGRRVPWWDDFQNITNEIGGSFDHAVALEKKGNWAILSQPYKIEDTEKLKAFCEKYGLSYMVNHFPRMYPHPDVLTILICKEPMYWVS